MNTISTLLLVAAIASVTATLSFTSAFAINNAQDDKNNPTFPGCGVGQFPSCQSTQAQDNTDRNCDRFESGQVGNGRNLPAQCY